MTEMHRQLQPFAACKPKGAAFITRALVSERAP
jgi:hypothetical protein